MIFDKCLSHSLDDFQTFSLMALSFGYFSMTNQSKNNARITVAPVRKSHVERSVDYSKAYISLELSRLFLFRGRTFIFFGILGGRGGKTKSTPSFALSRCAFDFCCSFPIPFRGRECLFNRANQCPKEDVCIHPV